MRISDFEKQYITTSRFDFENTDGFIVLREPTEDELLEFAQFKDDEAKLTKHILNNLIPACIIEHNFETDEGKPLNKSEVVSLLKKSGRKMQSTIKNWFESFSEMDEKETKKK